MADILNNDKPRLANTDSIDNYLVSGAGVDSDTPLLDIIICIARWALCAVPVDAVVSTDAVACQRIQIKNFILITSIAMVIWAGCDLCCRFATVAVLRKGRYCDDKQQGEGFAHWLSDFNVILTI